MPSGNLHRPSRSSAKVTPRRLTTGSCSPSASASSFTFAFLCRPPPEPSAFSSTKTAAPLFFFVAVWTVDFGQTIGLLSWMVVGGNVHSEREHYEGRNLSN